MTEGQIRGLVPALSGYLEPYLFSCGHTQTFEHLGVYCRGLLSDLPRKSVEPIALESGTPVRTLQEFLRDHRWDHHQLLDTFQAQLVQSHLARLPADDLGTVGLIDETSVVKKGTMTPGVARQYLGCVGKVDNGTVTVHLGLCRGRFKCLLDSELYLPKGWHDDRQRCRAAGIPDSVVYRPKWQIALEQLDRAIANGVELDWLTFDEEYGKRPGFLLGLELRYLRFVGEVPRSMSCRLNGNEDRWPADDQSGQRADELVRSEAAFTNQPWREAYLEQQTGPAVLWRYKAQRVWVAGGGTWGVRPCWLIWAINPASGEEKYFLSNAPASADVERLLRVAFRRWNVEHSFRVSKTELGFSHYEGRNYTGMMRHLALCVLMLGFVALQANRLQKKTTWVTMEQVCRALAKVCAFCLRRLRGTGVIRHLAFVIAYHQRRNAASVQSRLQAAALAPPVPP